jgi:23S rRNA (adenine2030-N6)-methyltransferase
MLSYRHAFHAGNHADALKHLVLTHVLQHAVKKDKPLWYIDTHAGAGKYALDQGYATKNAEFADGIARLWNDPQLPPALADYVSLVKKLNAEELRNYPGSPAFALQQLRSQDRLHLFELHPNDYRLLQQCLKTATHLPASRKATVHASDGFAGLKGLLPPTPRRAIVLIDPPYEQKQDYKRVVAAIKESLQRFATGTYLLWYPLLQRPEPLNMLNQIARLQPKSWLNVSLGVRAPSSDGFGMHGSGMLVINPPWTLSAMLTETMPYLTRALAQDDEARYTLDSQIP